MNSELTISKDFEVPFAGLKEGKYAYHWDISADFFSLFPYSELKDGKVHVNAELDKKANMLVFDITASGSAYLDCDRCGHELALPIANQEQIIYKFSEIDSEDGQDDDLMTLPRQAHQVNLAHQIYEIIHLSLPIKRVHEEGKCTGIEELNKYASTSQSGVTKDTRWEALNALSGESDN